MPDFRLIKGREYIQSFITGKIKEELKLSIKKIFENYGNLITTEMTILVTSGSRSGKQYFYLGAPYMASAPGEPPAMRSGMLAREFGFAAREKELEIYNDAESDNGSPYPLFLDEGTKKMNARPFFLTTVAKYEMQLKRDFEKMMDDNIEEL
jgi:hypothetical protein